MKQSSYISSTDDTRTISQTRSRSDLSCPQRPSRSTATRGEQSQTPFFIRSRRGLQTQVDVENMSFEMTALGSTEQAPESDRSHPQGSVKHDQGHCRIAQHGKQYCYFRRCSSGRKRGRADGRCRGGNAVGWGELRVREENECPSHAVRFTMTVRLLAIFE